MRNGCHLCVTLSTFPNLSRRFHDATIAHLEFFAKEGLRTLCLATRAVSDDEYDRWERLYLAATTDLSERQQELIDEAAELVERHLSLLGATAIEDKLQEGVPETIKNLRMAGIVVWVLTGDKQVSEADTRSNFICFLLFLGRELK